MSAASKEVILKPRQSDKKYFHIETKIASQSERRIEGFASTKFVDRVGDIVAPGALAASMQLYMQNPIVLLDHDNTQPIGKVVDWRVNSDGLFVTAQIMDTTTLANEAWAQIEFGARKAFSIGFIPKEIDWSGENPTITELELLEISVVSIPANRESLFSIAKAFELGTDMRDAKAPELGWEKTKSEIQGIKSVLKANYEGLPTEEKIFVDHFADWLQNLNKAEEGSIELKSDVERLEIEAEVSFLEAELASLE